METSELASEETEQISGIPKRAGDDLYEIRFKQTFSDPESEILTLRFNEDDSLLALGTSEGNIIIYSTQTGTLLHNIIASNAENPITSLRWRPRAYPSKSPNVLVSGNSEGVITHWHAKSGKYLTKIQEIDNQVLAMDYASDGRTFATAGKDFKVRIYDESTKAIIHEFPAASWQSPGHSNRIFSIKFIPKELNLLMSGGWDGNVHIWDLRVRKSVGSIFGPNISGDTLDFKNQMILTGSHRNKDYLEIWDLGTRKRLDNVSWDEGYYREGAYVYSCQFGGTERRNYILAACSGINEVKLFDSTNGGKTVMRAFGFEKGCYCVDWGKRGMAFGGGEGNVYLFNVAKK